MYVFIGNIAPDRSTTKNYFGQVTYLASLCFNFLLIFKNRDNGNNNVYILELVELNTVM